MGARKWIAIFIHLLLGVLFPYALVGCIVLLYGLMSPPTGLQRLYGAAIAALYLLALAAANRFLLRRLDRKERRRTAAVHAAAWIAAAAASFVILRLPFY